MKLIAYIDPLKMINTATLLPSIIEISDTEQTGMFYLFYYDSQGLIIADYCFFSLDEAKQQANYDFGIDYQEWSLS